MVTPGDPAPAFTVPMAGGDGYDDVSERSLSELLSDGPIVLAFVPGAFTSGCTDELQTIDASMDRFRRRNCRVFGVSVDLPFAQNIWMERAGFDIPLLSDWNHELIHAYDVVYPDMYGSIESAERSVFVIDRDGIVRYRWMRGDENPDFDVFVEDLIAEIDALD
ncbi:redoxin domain-containing protein [Halorubrum vacuolatum]|uniref:Peroxiredoxin n=1 Tax=Halorubrum vacuolatum TaxID=63740 RepID=A0A238WI06_HALVU|nr:redoxin domain-containing protein [Halorubrum vacuolatum]SNR46180.1 Peroxiredoxin [Halorubrum vacuolatum]